MHFVSDEQVEVTGHSPSDVVGEGEPTRAGPIRLPERSAARLAALALRSQVNPAQRDVLIVPDRGEAGRTAQGSHDCARLVAAKTSVPIASEASDHRRL